MTMISQVFEGAPAEAREPVEQRVYEKLRELDIPFTRVDHDAIFTMEGCAAISEIIGVSTCKNLLLAPRNKSTFYLYCTEPDKMFSSKDFSKVVGSSRLSFAGEEDLMTLLGVTPGSASILGLINDVEHRVSVVLDRSVAEAEYFGCHPCRNTSTLRLKTADVLYKFLPALGYEPVIIDE